jgi:pyruvate/2-oxoglutarate dehydrogenase complex dihydrolipoamide acyltransferase (E2) component
VSWTGFVIASVGRAVARHPEVNARRAGSRIVQLDRMDVGATVERHADGEVVLDAVAIRSADTASCTQVTDQLRRVKTATSSPTRSGWGARVTRLPGPVRRTVFRVAGTRPRIAATYGPPVGVTSIGMFSQGWGWAVPIPPLTVIVTVGGVADRAVVRDGQVVVRPQLPLTVSFDHAVVDGAPATRFVETLRELIEGAVVLRGDA